MSITEFSLEFDRRMRAAEAALSTRNGYTYGWVEPRQILATMELDGISIDAEHVGSAIAKTGDA